MYKSKFFIGLAVLVTIVSCSSSSVIITAAWANREKMPADPLKSVFIMAFSDNLEVRSNLEYALATAAEKKGLKTYKSLDIIGPVDMKSIAPVKDHFIKKLKDLNCESIFTIALVNATSETKYVEGSTISVYAPYSYNEYANYTGYGGYGPHGGFGGYYGYAVSTMSPGYYKTDKTYFLEAKLFDLNTDELLLSIQTTAKNPKDIEKSSLKYTETLMKKIESMDLRKK